MCTTPKQILILTLLFLRTTETASPVRGQPSREQAGPVTVVGMGTNSLWVLPSPVYSTAGTTALPELGSASLVRQDAGDGELKCVQDRARERQRGKAMEIKRSLVRATSQ